MARMYPRTLLDDEVKSAGETEVFALLREGLDEGWEVFHSVGWVRRDHAEGALDGEIDFVLCHPDRAIVCLEVKGGPIECRHGEWRRRLDGQMVRVKDPFWQALDHRYALERMVDAVEGWRGRDLLIVHAVALPHVPVHALALAPDAPAELLLDRHALTDVAAALDRVLAFHTGARERRRPPGAEGASMLRELLAPTVEIEVPMAHAFDEEERALVELTREQSLLLGRLHRNPRMAVYGCAGSGKTMLAVEHAKRLAAAGRHVLFVCFTKALAKHLKATEGHERITFSTFHSLCKFQARRAKLDVPEFGEDPPQSWWDHELPELLVDALGERGAQWDALIVDEAQDLHDHWLTALRCGLHDEATAPVWLFLDDNQRVFDAQLTVPADFVRWELSTNCRTTAAIHRVLLGLYHGEVAPDVRGPEGREPELVHTDDQPATLDRLLARLLGPDDVRADDLVVLSSHGRERSSVDEVAARRGVAFSSIRAFKGLERPVVVLCELEDLDERTRDQQLYVGMSRARNHCVVVAPPAAGVGSAP